ncbi:MAG: hypothetical protein ISQ06_11270 [Planctomycetaceae bacterium]|nr:hypothetical protein [Planctomycetaceae bacterium]
MKTNKPGIRQDTGLCSISDFRFFRDAACVTQTYPAADGDNSAGGAGAGAASVGAAGAYGAAGAAQPGGHGAEAGAAQLGVFGAQAGAQAGAHAAGAQHEGAFGAQAGAQGAGAAQLGFAVQQLAAGAAHDGFIEHRSSFGILSFGRQSFGRSIFGMHIFGSSSFGSLKPEGQPQSPAFTGAIWKDKAAAVSKAAAERFMAVSPQVKVGT